MIVLWLTAIAGSVTVVLLLVRLVHQPTGHGRHTRSTAHPPGPVLARALANAGRHGLASPHAPDTHTPPRDSPATADLSTQETPMTTLQQPAILYGDLHWPVTVATSSTGPRLLVGEGVDALSMPAWFGAQVNHYLALCLLSAPIFADLGGLPRWIFLTRAREHTVRRPIDNLVGMGVTAVAPGALDLPSLTPPVGGNRWVTPPVPLATLPPWAAVVGAARRSFPG
jgi:hypothetical protein